MIFRCYVEQRPGYDVTAQILQAELREILHLSDIEVRQFKRYDVQNIVPNHWDNAVQTVLGQPMCDAFYQELPKNTQHTLYIEPLPGQFDLHADTYEQCIQMLVGGERPIVKVATVYMFNGINDQEFESVKTYLINPLESRETTADKPTCLHNDTQNIEDVPIVIGFNTIEDAALHAMLSEYNLAMSIEDLRMIQAHFQNEKRNPTLAELRVFDTYWSDHCRHTTFHTIIENTDIKDERVRRAYELFLSVNGDKPTTLMNIATASMRHLRKIGKLPMLDESAETNACTVRIKAEFDHDVGDDALDVPRVEDWLLLFKNETHNHPTEIEPYGGASTCVGGAIRDTMSGRAYTYHAMRITGSGDPRVPIKNTLPGKLPQRKITTTAAEGNSDYGNQIGLPAGLCKEIYHPGYIAKRMECGAVVAAVPTDWVKREEPMPGDVIVLLGGRTGRDGIGGASGSSKELDKTIVDDLSVEVQRGNAPEERKFHRLFRNPNVTQLIKRCNDFGAGGVSVAIGEIADGVIVNLDTIPVKYNGMNGIELALSESQERMAVVLDAGDVKQFLEYAKGENTEATVVGEVTERRYMTMTWRGKTIIDICRDFLDTSGSQRKINVYVEANSVRPIQKDVTRTGEHYSHPDDLFNLAQNLNFCSQKGLIERFDATIGAASVLVPLGGKNALTETQVMAALLPSKGAQTASVMSYGFDPHLTERDPFGGSVWAVITSVAKLIASGVSLDTIHLTLQEYFHSLRDCPERWGKPFAAILGAFSAQIGLGIAAIGGKDSMSGSFKKLDVPPTLISFAIGVQNVKHIISPEFKAANNNVYLLEAPLCDDGLPDYDALKTAWIKYNELLRNGKVLSAWACETGGVLGGIIKMAFGNKIGFVNDEHWTSCDTSNFGSIIFETSEALNDYKLLGRTQNKQAISLNDKDVVLDDLIEAWSTPLKGVFA